MSSEFLFAYFKSSFITDLLTRDTTATMHPAVRDDDIMDLPFIKPNEGLENTVTQKVTEAIQSLAQSKCLYSQAEELLLSELGFWDLDLSPTLLYERSFSETQQAARLDAEFFQLVYKLVLKALESTNPKRIVPLEEYLTLLTNGHTPRHHDLSEGDIPLLTTDNAFDFRIAYVRNNRSSLRSTHRFSEV